MNMFSSLTVGNKGFNEFAYFFMQTDYDISLARQQRADKAAVPDD